MVERIQPIAYVSHLAEMAGIDQTELQVAPLLIVAWDLMIVQYLVDQLQATASNVPYLKHYLYHGEIENQRVSVALMPAGSPATVMRLEQLIAYGARTVIGVGLAGSLTPKAPIGSCVIPDACLREEGTSVHYITDDGLLTPDQGLMATLVESFQQGKGQVLIGGVWTTDAFFRETEEKIQKYREQGMLCVDMETSSMYALGKFRNVAVCNLLIISDELWTEWNPAFGGGRLKLAMVRAQKKLLRAIRRILVHGAAGSDVVEGADEGGGRLDGEN